MASKLNKRKMVQIAFSTLNDSEFNVKDLKKVLHKTLWDMRGKFGWSNIKIMHSLTERQFDEPGHPKEALSWDYWEERIDIVATYPNGRYRDSTMVYINNTDTFDGDDSRLMNHMEFLEKEVHVSHLTKRYLEEVLIDRLEYFKMTKDYKFKTLIRHSDDFGQWD